MDQTQSRALAALEPFVALSKSASSSRAAAELIVQAISAPNTYVFAELLQTPNIRALGNGDADASAAAHLKLLEIFAWGTWEDYACKLNWNLVHTLFGVLRRDIYDKDAND